MMGFLFIAALSLLDVSHLANTTSKIVLERTKAIYVVQYCNNIRIQTYSISYPPILIGKETVLVVL